MKFIAILLGFLISTSAFAEDLWVNSIFEGDKYASEGREFISGGARWRSVTAAKTSWPNIVKKEEGAPVCEGDQSVSIYVNLKSPVNNFRTEFRMGKHNQGEGRSSKFLPFNEEMWFGAAYFIPEDWVADRDGYDILLQFHGTPDSDIGETWRNPPLNFNVTNGHWNLKVRADHRRKTPDRNSYPVSKSYRNIAPLIKGRWFDIIVNYVIDPVDGWVIAYIDGQKVVEHRGGFSFNDARGPYINIGNYKAHWGALSEEQIENYPFTERQHWYDSVKLGPAEVGFKGVSPPCVKRMPPPINPDPDPDPEEPTVLEGIGPIRFERYTAEDGSIRVKVEADLGIEESE